MGFRSSSSSSCGPELIRGETFFFGSLAFMADDSAWLADSPLQAQLLPSRGSVHFRADESGALRLQLPVHSQVKALLPSRHKKKRSGRPRASYRSKSLLTQQVAVIDSVESAQQAIDDLIAKEGPTASLLHIFNASDDENFVLSGPEPEAEQEGSSGSPITMAEVCMAGTPPPQASPQRGGGNRDNEEAQLGGRGRQRISAVRRLELGGSSRQPPTWEEQAAAEAAERMLQTPIDTSTPEGQHLEAARQTNLAERQRLIELQNTLEHQAREVARLRQSRTSRQLRGGGEEGPFRALNTPIENLIAATRIANSLQPSGSAAEGIEHLAFLLQKAVEQNAEVSQSLQRVHSQPPLTGTSQSVYTPQRNRNHSPRNRRDPYDEYHHEQFCNPEFRGGDEHAARRREEDYVARRREEDYAARRPSRDVSRREGFERRRVDHQGFREIEDDARSHLVQNRVDHARMHRQDQGSYSIAIGPICFSERIRSTPIPPHFRIAQGVEKYRGDAKPQTWIDDYRIEVQIGGGGDEIVLMHLPLMLEGSARTWLNQLPPNSIWVWEDLVRVFVKNFEGTYKRTGGLTELQLCVQGHAEPTREYIQRWITLHNSVEGVSEFQAIHAFKQGVKYKELSLKLSRSPDVTSLGRLMEIANKYVNGEEEIRQKSQQFRGGGNNSASNPKQKNGGGSGKRKAEEAPTDAEMVAAANATGIHGKSQPRKEWQPRQKKPTNDDILDQPCPLHTTRDAEGKTVIPKHTARQCRLIKRAAQNARTGSQQNKERKKEDSS